MKEGDRVRVVKHTCGTEDCLKIGDVGEIVKLKSNPGHWDNEYRCPIWWVDMDSGDRWFMAESGLELLVTSHADTLKSLFGA